MADTKQRTGEFEGFAFYHYLPSAAAALLFTALFGISTLLHIYQMARTRTWFVIPFIVGGLFSTVGYIGRYLSHQQAPDYTLGPYIQQTLLLLVAPALFAGTIYMELKRIIIAIQAEHSSPVKVRWLTKLFVTGDLLSFFAQGGGGGLMATKKPDTIKTGERIVVGGLFIQLIFFALFVVTSVLVHIRTNRTPTPYSELPNAPWRKHMYALYFMSILIFIRSVFRVIEYLQGYTGFLLTKEVFLYIFDAVLMFLTCITLNFIHPSEIDALTHGGLVSRAAGLKYEYVDPIDAKNLPAEAEMSHVRRV